MQATLESHSDSIALAMSALDEIGARFCVAGDTEPSVEINLTNGDIAIVDESDASRVLEKKWRRFERSALTTTEPAWSMAQWVIGKRGGTSITHRNGNSLDCRRANLICPFHHTTLHTGRAEIRMPGMHSAWISLEDVVAVQSRRWIIHPCPKFDLFYAIGRLPGIKRGHLLHTILMPDVFPIDHVNRDGLDCRRSNLRAATTGQNSWNARKQVNSKWPYKGISKRKLRWGAMITHRGKEIWLGQYKTQEEAARAYDAKARELFGEFACVNFPIGNERCAI